MVREYTLLLFFLHLSFGGFPDAARYFFATQNMKKYGVPGKVRLRVRGSL